MALKNALIMQNDNGTTTTAIQIDTDTATDLTLTLPAVAGTVFNQGNVVGTVSESSGVPTGAIIERGENANGEYVKYADGTLIFSVVGKESPTMSGTIINIPLTYPATFSSTPELSTQVNQRFPGGGVASSSKILCINNVFVGASSATPRIVSSQSESAGTYFTYGVTAIGRWF